MDSSVENNRIPRGAGLSYCAASFNKKSTSVSHLLLNRIINFSEDEMIIEAEAGIRLGQLFQFLSKFELYIASQPGHSSITLGGCIAANTHGKDSFQKGSFSNQVESIKLFHPSHGIIEASRYTHPDIFELTCGGFGLTGHILSAKVKLNRFKSYIVNTSPEETQGLDYTMKFFEENSRNNDFMYSWHDIRKNKDFGVGIIFNGKFDKSITAKNNSEHLISKLNPPQSIKIRSPLPFGIFNSFTRFGINTVFSLKNSSKIQNSLYKTIYAAENFDYYFSLFGTKGFHEYQVIIPPTAISYFARELKKYIDQNKILITLCSCKYFSEKRSLLRFRADGLCLSLNFPRNAASDKFCVFLDALCIDTGSLPNIIKDSRITKRTIDLCYPEADFFRERLHNFDPKHIFRSELSDRLDL